MLPTPERCLGLLQGPHCLEALQVVECLVCFTLFCLFNALITWSGTPSQVTRPSEDATMLSLDDHRTRKRNTPGDQSMRRTVQDLVSSIDPNVKIEPEVEDVCAIAFFEDVSDPFSSSCLTSPMNSLIR
jgi:hypothetical protein